MVTIFRELRSGVTLDGKSKIKIPSGTLSTAEAISVVNNGLAMAAHFGDGELKAADLAAGIIGAVVNNPVQDKVVCRNIWKRFLSQGRIGKTCIVLAGTWIKLFVIARRNDEAICCMNARMIAIVEASAF